MGLHTWFYKDKNLHKERQELYSKLDKYDEGEIFLDNMEILQLEHRIDEIDDQNDTNFHDCFRTNKREENGEYTYDVIYSENECKEWLKNNHTGIYSLNNESLNNFWNQYPDGCIDFG